MNDYLRVGELARRTGVTVRTLHHYDELGLLKPAVGGAGQNRLYGPAEMARLLQIRSLQALGMSLEEVARCLDDPEFAPLPVIEKHLSRLDRQVELARRLRARLEAIAQSLRKAKEPSADELLQALEFMSQMEELFDKYYSPEQRKYLAQRAEAVGPERMAQAQQDWQDLFDDYRAAMDRGDDPESEAVLDLARRSQALIAEFTGGDSGIHASLSKMYADNPEAKSAWGTSSELNEFMGRAARALNERSD